MMKGDIKNFKLRFKLAWQLSENLLLLKGEQQFFLIKQNVILGVVIIAKGILYGGICFWVELII